MLQKKIGEQDVLVAPSIILFSTCFFCELMMVMMMMMYTGRVVDQNKTSTKSSSIVDTDDVRTARLSLQVGQEDMKDGSLTLEAGSTGLHHVNQSLQPVVDCRIWPRLDVTMATRIQPASIVELGNTHHMIQHLNINV